MPQVQIKQRHPYLTKENFLSETERESSTSTNSLTNLTLLTNAICSSQFCGSSWIIQKKSHASNLPLSYSCRNHSDWSPKCHKQMTNNTSTPWLHLNYRKFQEHQDTRNQIKSSKLRTPGEITLSIMKSYLKVIPFNLGEKQFCRAGNSLNKTANTIFKLSPPGLA